MMYSERKKAMGYQDTFKRVEIKYLLTRQQKELLLRAMEPYMEPDSYGRTAILNIYYDTPEYTLIRRSLEKPIYKEKLRLRSYGIPEPEDNVFIELKKKYKGIVYKRRISTSLGEALKYLSGEAHLRKQNQITREIDYFRSFYQGLAPAMVISYEREAYFSKDSSDLRITFDEKIFWREEELSLQKGSFGTPILKEDQTLLEVKTAAAMPLWLTAKLSELGIFQTSFSKYGNAYLQKIQPCGADQERKAL